MSGAAPLKETAYYYPEPYWLANEGGWIKSLLLFFDEVAILLPDYMYGSHALADPTLAEPLEDQGLLRVLEPEWFIDKEAATELTDLIGSLIESGAFDDLPQLGSFAALSMSRMGNSSADQLARAVYEQLAERGLATSSEDGVSIPMHPVVRKTFLVVLAQLARRTGLRHGLDLQPIANDPAMPAAFRDFLQLKQMPSHGQVVAFDANEVSIDLDAVSLEEVLQYRRENGDEHRRYMKNMRSFALEVSLADDAERPRLFAERRAELQEHANELRNRAVDAWKRPKDVAGFTLGLAGAAWSLAADNPLPAALAAVGAGLAMLPSSASGSAYSYLFHAPSGRW